VWRGINNLVISKNASGWQDPAEQYLNSATGYMLNIRQVTLSLIWLQLTGHTSPVEGQPYTTCRLALDEPLFTSGRDADTLYFLSDDLLYLQHLDTRGWLYQYNLYLNVLADRFAARNITFYYVSAVNKFDFYYQRITNNLYPVNPVYDALDSRLNAFYYINPKKILEKKLAEGDKDLYFLGSTHWSWKTVEYLSYEISPLESKPKRFPYNESINSLPADMEILRSYAQGLKKAGEYGYADQLNRKIAGMET
jgi:hypothetical protein